MHYQFSRTVAPDTSKGPALIAFMQQNNWKKIVIASSTESIWFDTRLGLVKQLEAAGIEVFKPAAFEPGSFEDTTLSEIRRTGKRSPWGPSPPASVPVASSICPPDLDSLCFVGSSLYPLANVMNK